MRRGDFSDLVGRSFGQLNVLGIEIGDDGKSYCNTLCSCGNNKLVLPSRLGKTTKSCGCKRGSHFTKILTKYHGCNRKQASKYSHTKSSAARRKLSFTLSLPEFLGIIESPCTYCGGFESGKIGIDRVDNSHGYEMWNCVPACTTCNWFKNKHSSDFFVTHCIKVADHCAAKFQESEAA